MHYPHSLGLLYTAFTYYCADHRRDVDALPFNQRAAALGEMWRQHADRATYDRKALADRARFVRETAEYDAAMQCPTQCLWWPRARCAVAGLPGRGGSP